MNQYHKIMEVFWLLIAVVSLAYAMYMAGQSSFEESSMYFLFPVVAGILFSLRYFMRKRFEKMKDED
jgi:membrane protease YdiL (CAAX protease family)